MRTKRTTTRNRIFAALLAAALLAALGAVALAKSGTRTGSRDSDAARPAIAIAGGKKALRALASGGTLRFRAVTISENKFVGEASVKVEKQVGEDSWVEVKSTLTINANQTIILGEASISGEGIYRIVAEDANGGQAARTFTVR